MMKEIDLGSGFVLIAGQGRDAFSGSVIGRLYTRKGNALRPVRSYLRSTLDDCVGAALQDLRQGRFGPYRGKGEETSGDE